MKRSVLGLLGTLAGIGVSVQAAFYKKITLTHSIDQIKLDISYQDRCWIVSKPGIARDEYAAT